MPLPGVQHLGNVADCLFDKVVYHPRASGVPRARYAAPAQLPGWHGVRNTSPHVVVSILRRNPRHAPGAEIFLPAAMRASQFHCVANTVLSLLGSCFACFGVSALVENKFNMVHIQARGVPSSSKGQGHMRQGQPGQDYTGSQSAGGAAYKEPQTVMMCMFVRGPVR